MIVNVTKLTVFDCKLWFPYTFELAFIFGLSHISTGRLRTNMIGNISAKMVDVYLVGTFDLKTFVGRKVMNFNLKKWNQL